MQLNITYFLLEEIARWKWDWIAAEYLAWPPPAAQFVNNCHLPQSVLHRTLGVNSYLSLTGFMHGTISIRKGDEIVWMESAGCMDNSKWGLLRVSTHLVWSCLAASHPPMTFHLT
jgi:hypothetical protein